MNRYYDSKVQSACVNQIHHRVKRLNSTSIYARYNGTQTYCYINCSNGWKTMCHSENPSMAKTTSFSEYKATSSPTRRKQQKPGIKLLKVSDYVRNRDFQKHING
ncbi:hypothetical protein TNCV_150851 [Trichonephila clavipes]|nr:hypothetical protein TNCV_150851 [Trichonephila clavipes]